MGYKLGKEARTGDPPDFRGLPGSNYFIMIIHGSRSVRQMIKLFLKSYNIDFGEAGDASAAFSVLSDRRPDLLLIDIEMPGLNGEEKLIRDILSDVRFMDIPAAIIGTDNERTPAEIKYSQYYQAKLSLPISQLRIINVIKSFLPVREKRSMFTIEEMRPDIKFLVVETAPYRDNLEIILDVMENELMDEWKRAVKTLQRDNEERTKNFLANLDILEMKFGIPQLRRYIKDLTAAITNRRKIKRDILMDRFPEITSKLRSEFSHSPASEEN